MRDLEVRGAAKSLFEHRGPEVLIAGAAGTGKTVSALAKLHITCLLVPGVQALVVRQTHASLTASTLVAFEQIVAQPEIAAGECVWFGGSGSKPAGYRYKNGSMIMVGGMDNPGKVLSMSLDRILVDEADQISQTAYETLLTRLRGTAPTYKQLVAACNPAHPEHYLKERADDPAQDLTLYTSLHQDNPYLYNRDGTPTEAGADYVALLAKLTGIRRARYYEGRWQSAEGLVWDVWDDAHNLVDALPAGHESWRQFWTVDFGYSNSFVWQRWLVDGDGRLWLTHEIARRQRLVEDHARDILALMKANEWTRPEAIVCDHDAEDRATLERHLGMPTVAARKDVILGVQAVYSRVRQAGDGRPRLLVLRSALIRNDPLAKSDKRPRGFAAEVTGYVWSVERGTDGRPKEVPLKLNDHSCDAARYAVMYLDGAPPAKVNNPAQPGSSSPRQGSKWSTAVGATKV